MGVAPAAAEDLSGGGQHLCLSHMTVNTSFANLAGDELLRGRPAHCLLLNRHNDIGVVGGLFRTFYESEWYRLHCGRCPWHATCRAF